jgi:phosphoenolpyruvate carboxylase
MFARSDSAMSYGMMSSVLSVIIAIHKTQRIAEKSGISIEPILGCGALPFRGHLDLKNVDRILETYGGIRTFTIQSGMRYDHGANETKKLVNRLNVEASLTEARAFTHEEIKLAQEMIAIFTKHYMTSFIEMISPLEEITKLIPRNRDRLASSRTGLEYVREIAHMEEIAALTEDETLKVELLAIDTDIHCTVPRAISFTAALYTVGMPPEFIGVGRGLHEIVQKYGQEGLRFLLSVYPQLKHDLNFALKYMNQKISRGIFSEQLREAYQLDVMYAIEYLHLKERDDAYREDAFYHTLLKAIRPILLHNLGKQKDLFDDHEEEMKILKEWIVKLGKLRGSLG